VSRTVAAKPSCPRHESTGAQGHHDRQGSPGRITAEPRAGAGAIPAIRAAGTEAPGRITTPLPARSRSAPGHPAPGRRSRPAQAGRARDLPASAARTPERLGPERGRAYPRGASPERASADADPPPRRPPSRARGHSMAAEGPLRRAAATPLRALSLDGQRIAVVPVAME
jgi:hypothetical protein